MADRPLTAPLPADLPEDWTSGQIVAPAGADVGLSEQHGYNYLMAAVNAAQRAVNAIDESFDDISGKRTCRVTVGTSAAGWTQADCDYLCDGTDDQVELNAAIAAVKAAGGGEVSILGGVYHPSGYWTIDAEGTALDISGEPGATVLELSNEITINRVIGSNMPEFLVRFFGITLIGAQDGIAITSWETSLSIESCTLQNVAVVFYGVDSPRKFSFRCNIAENTTLQAYGERSVCSIAGNFFRMSKALSDPKHIVSTGVIEGVVFANNTVIYEDEAVDAQISMDDHSTITGNCLYGTSIVVLNAPSICASNVVQNGGISGSSLNDEAHVVGIVGNSVDNGTIEARGHVTVVGNSIAAPADTDAIRVYKGSSFLSGGEISPNINGNVIVAGGSGIHLVEPSAQSIDSPSKALICGNHISGCTTSIQIASRWSGCLVTGNMIETSVVDSGTGNIVRLNSDDAGSGGSGGAAGVSSFKGRSGAVVPQAGDYTAAMVGARADTWIPTAAEVGAVPSGTVTAIQSLTQAEYDALSATAKAPSTLYLVKE